MTQVFHRCSQCGKSERVACAEAEIERLREEVDCVSTDLNDEIDRLCEIVDKLPKTVDGVPVVPGMRLWTTYNSGRDVTGFDTVDGRLVEIRFGDGFDRCVWAQYSTREAAEAAKEKP